MGDLCVFTFVEKAINVGIYCGLKGRILKKEGIEYLLRFYGFHISNSNK